jgi:threonine dehydrogenase-like Zn-dependent dehydrogenase
VHRVPDELTDNAAVMVEPIACAIHGALTAKLDSSDNVIVLGAGTLGLGVLAAIRAFSVQPASITVAAKYAHQKAFAINLGADEVCAPSAVQRSARRISGSQVIGSVGDERLTDGIDVVIDCVGNASSIEQALRIVRPGGRIILVGMPGHESLDLTALWHREVSLQGAYAYGVELLPDGKSVRTFDLAMQLVVSADLGRLVTATYPLDHWRDAIEHAANAGARGAVKIAFDPRSTKHSRGALT